MKKRRLTPELTLIALEVLVDLEKNHLGTIDGDQAFALLTEAIGPQIGAKIKKFRLNSKLTQAAVAKKLRVSQAEISKLESGQRALTIVQADVLARILGRVPEWFVLAGPKRSS